MKALKAIWRGLLGAAGRVGDHPVTVIARRELRARVRTFTYLASTLFVLVLAAGAAAMPLIPVNQSREVAVVYAVEDHAAGSGYAERLEAVAAQAGMNLEVETLVTADPSWEAETLVLEREAGAAVVITDGPYPTEVLFLSAPDPAVLTALATTTSGGAIPHFRLVAPPATDASNASVGLVAATVLLTAVTFNSTIVLFGVVEEKSTRVIEVLLARARAVDVLVGKIIGICVASAAQFCGFVGGYLGLSAVLGTSLIPRQVFSGWLGLWLVVGYVISSLLAATLGSLVSRPEDAPQVTTPLTLLLAGTFVLALPIAAFPESPYGLVLSLFPPTAAPAMMIRIPVTTVPVYQQVASLLGVAVFILGLGRWASGIYSRTALAFGSRLRFRELIRPRR